jgi:hypothetical protein
MDAKVMNILGAAKQLHDVGKFGVLEQAEFFKNVELAMAEEGDPESAETEPGDPPPEA